MTGSLEFEEGKGGLQRRCRKRLTEVLARLAGNGDLLSDGPFTVVGRNGFVVGIVDVIGDTGFDKAFAEIFGEGSPCGVLFTTAEEKFDFDSEVEGTSMGSAHCH